MNENKILRNLEKGIQTDETLREYADWLSMSYTRLAAGRLALNFSAYYDDLEKAGGLDGEKLQAEFGLFLELTKRQINGDPDGTDRSRLDSLREGVRQRMKRLYAYVHTLGLYEHLFSRLEYSFEEDEAEDVDILMSEIHSYISEADNPAEMNSRMQSVMGGMPVRMTKSRFFHLVEKSCSSYVGSRSDMADYFFEDMYLQAVWPSAEDLSSDYPDLKDAVQEMAAIDLEALDKDTVKTALDRLQIAGQQISTTLFYDFEMIELVNDLYILMLNPACLALDRETMPLAARVIRAYMKAAEEENFLGMDEDILDDLERLEQVRERIAGMHMLLEDRLPTVQRQYGEAIERLQLKDVFGGLRRSALLSGTDETVDLNENTDKEIFVADRVYIRKKTDKLLSMYTSLFASLPIIMRRAVISEALAKLPVASDSLDEWEDMIWQTLENCKNQAEIKATAEYMRQIMNEEGWQE